MLDFYSREGIPWAATDRVLLADKLVVPAMVLFCLSGGLVLLLQDPGLPALLVAIVTGVVLFRFFVVPRITVLDQITWSRGGLGVFVGVMALVAVAVEASSGSELATHLWPLFLPGVVLFVRSQSQVAIRGHLTRLTWYTFGYAVICGVTVAVGAFQAPIVGAIDMLVRLVWPAWTVLITMFTYYVIRRGDVIQQQAQVVLSVERSIATGYGTFDRLDEVASLLQSVGYELVLILQPDKRYSDQFFDGSTATDDVVLDSYTFDVAASAGRGSENVRELRLPMSKGISGRSVRLRQPQNVADVHLDPDYVGLGLVGIQSELNVPVFDRLTSQRCLAVICVLSRRKAAFSWRDEAVFSRVGDALEQRWAFKSSGDYYANLHSVIEELQDVDQFEDLAETFPAALQPLLETAHIAFLPFGLGTLVPDLRCAKIVPSGLTADELQSFIRDETLTAVAIDWEPLLISQADPRWTLPAIACLAAHWRVLPQTGTIAVLPVGSRAFRIGLLVVGYRGSLKASEAINWRLLTAAQTVAPQLMALAYRDRLYLGFMKPSLSIHTIVTELGRGAVTEVLKKYQNLPREVEATLHRVDSVMNRVYDALDVKESELLMAPELLQSTLTTYVTQVRVRNPDAMISARVAAEVENESRELKIILYRLACEAMSNALKKGAMAVAINIGRQPDAVEFSARDNGPGFDVGLVLEQEHGGTIFRLLDAARRYCVIREIEPAAHWKGTELGTGCQLTITFEATIL